MKPWLLLLTALHTRPAAACPAPRTTRPTTPPDAACETVVDTALPDEDLPRGCGWFDSSHELHCGLSVQEHANPDSLVRELPLASWIELHLSGWSAPSPAV